MGDADKDAPTHCGPVPKQIGPAKRWWFLALWVGCDVAIVAAQKLAAASIDMSHWTPAGPQPTLAGSLWAHLPLLAIAFVAVAIFVGLRWWVPEKGTRGLIRLWGLLATYTALVVSAGICLCQLVVVYVNSLD